MANRLAERRIVAEELLEITRHTRRIDGCAALNVNTHHRWHHFFEHRGGLGICCAVAAEEAVSAAVARGDSAKPKLRASALIANVVFSCFSISIYQITQNCCVTQIRFIPLSSGIKFMEKVKIYWSSLQNSWLIQRP